LSDLKRQIREEILAQRKLLTPQDLADGDEALLKAFKVRLTEDEKLSAALSGKPFTAVYEAVRGELPCDMLSDFIKASGGRTCYPVVNGREMVFREVKNPKEDLIKTENFGLFEPREGLPEVSPSDIGIVVMPGVSFTKEGIRLGYGGGYYDRWLSGFSERGQERPLTLGVCMSFQMRENLPVDPFDIAADMVLCV